MFHKRVKLPQETIRGARREGSKGTGQANPNTQCLNGQQWTHPIMALKTELKPGAREHGSSSDTSAAGEAGRARAAPTCPVQQMDCDLVSGLALDCIIFPVEFQCHTQQK